MYNIGIKTKQPYVDTIGTITEREFKEIMCPTKAYAQNKLTLVVNSVVQKNDDELSAVSHAIMFHYRERVFKTDSKNVHIEDLHLHSIKVTKRKSYTDTNEI